MSTHEIARPDAAARNHQQPQPSSSPGAAPLVSGQDTAAPPVPALVRRGAPGSGDPLGGTAAEPDLVDALRRRRGAGRPLPATVAQDFGEQLGTDLSGVRVHADAEADRISRSVQATAFAHGNDLYFAQGAYSPGSPHGQHLLAHELAHVVQERSAPVRAASPGPVIGRADDPAEAAADATASNVLAALRRRADQVHQ